ncbi:chromate efflux transporter [Neiella marina]|uniref:Chromate efflux transporter n=1 Tax=Neiella holothuriorum TaxID=2870530 RepID=A0ABS7EFB3_9GAMM|nr:chromate efflux transporter [Neiella holothuriorum]MBW8191042.1 chromate efflux transporter [Neiella holothuriorum]
MWQIFKQFFALGWVSFGGPAAHLGYFQRHFVHKLGWLDQPRYAQLIALSQFLPGPGSSQVGFAIGYQRAGLLGGLAAFIGFTAPSFAIMAAIALLNTSLTDNSFYQGVIHSLKLFAVVIVADAVITMSKQFWSKQTSLLIGLVSTVVMLLQQGLWTQLLVLAGAAVIGASQPEMTAPTEKPCVDDKACSSPLWWALVLFGLLFFVLPLIAGQSSLVALFSEFFQAGSLVFGGGHVVLPLLQESLAGQISQDSFLLGYASAQAIPGPMFTLATFLGAELTPSSPLLGALVATVAIFAPGLLLMVGLLNSWQALVARPRLAGAISAVNAAVVGLLVSAWYAPVFTSSVFLKQDFAAVVVGFVLLRQLKVPVLYLVAGYVALGLLLAL